MLTAKQAVDVAAGILSAHREEDARLARVADYLRGSYAAQAFIPSKPGNRAAHAEYLALVARSRWPVLSLPVDTLAQNLWVDGYRPARAAENATQWGHWQANRMDARQGGLHRAAIAYGVAYLTVLPGDGVPVWRPSSPRRMRTLWADRINDEWPVYALEPWAEGTAGGQVERFRLLDDTNSYELTRDGHTFTAGEVREHGTGFCPVVRYLGQPDLDGVVTGEVEPLIPLQDQLDATTFYVEMAQQFAVHRQRWVSGMAIPEDDDGTPVEPFQMAIDRLLVAEDPDTKFGEFAQTDTKAWLDGREASQRAIAIKSQTPPGYMLGEMVNLSAEALAATEAPAQRRAGAYRTSLGESHEQAFRLSALQAGDDVGWADTSAQVVWRDTESRSLAQVADALGKLAGQLGIPARALWEKVPGVTDQDLTSWEAIAVEDARRRADTAAAALGLAGGQ